MESGAWYRVPPVPPPNPSLPINLSVKGLRRNWLKIGDLPGNSSEKFPFRSCFYFPGNASPPPPAHSWRSCVLLKGKRLARYLGGHADEGGPAAGVRAVRTQNELSQTT